MNLPEPVTGASSLIELSYGLNWDQFSLAADLSIPARGITGIFGESGSGKTSLLRCIAGLEKSATAKLAVNGQLWQDSSISLSRPVHERQIAYVFQDAHLFSHLNVRKNLEYGLRRNKQQGNGHSLEQITELLGLASLLERAPDKLSGGEAQRVAIARALLSSPELVLMDEPLAGLDRARKEEILPFLDRLHTELDIPMLYVSHSIEEICRLCDHLVVMERGQILANDELQSVLVRMDLPILTGEAACTVIQAEVESHDPEYDLSTVSFSGGQLLIPGDCGTRGETVRLRIQASDISLCRETPQNTTILNILPVIVDEIQPEQGPYMLLRLRAGEDRLLAKITRRSCEDLALHPGDSLLAQIKSVAVRNLSAI
jgi:molybdate transport system ATP-binding protein